MSKSISETCSEAGSGGSAARAWHQHRMHGTRALTDLAEAGVLIPIGIFAAANGMGCGYHQACDLWFDVCIHGLHLQSSDST
jgi:hypothetical protein